MDITHAPSLGKLSTAGDMLPPIGRRSSRRVKMSHKFKAGASLSELFEHGFENKLETLEEENLRASEMYASTETLHEREHATSFGHAFIDDHQAKVCKEKDDNMKSLDLETTPRIAKAQNCSLGKLPTSEKTTIGSEDAVKSNLHFMGIFNEERDDSNANLTNDTCDDDMKAGSMNQGSIIKGHSERKSSVSSFTLDDYVHEKKNPMEDTYLSNYFEDSKIWKELEEKEVKDDNWGDLTDVFNMLSDGLMSYQKTEKVVSVEDLESLSLQKPKENIESLTFGEYQPSCLSGRKGVVHGRRRTVLANPLQNKNRTEKPYENFMEGATMSNEPLPIYINGEEIKSNGKVSHVFDTPIIQPQILSNHLQDNDSIPMRDMTLAKAGVDEKVEQRVPEDPLMPMQKNEASTRTGEKGLLDVPKCVEASDVLESPPKDQNPKDKGTHYSNFDPQTDAPMKGNDISIQNNLVHKEHVENDTEDSAVRITHLKEEKVERETWAIEKNISTLEFSDESLLLKRLDQEKMQAQCLAAELSSEVQFLKSSSVVAQEKLHSLQVVHREEVNMLKHVHDWELEAKEKHIATERSFLLEQGAIRETLTQLMGKAKDWSIKVEALQEALAIERELSNNDRIKWLDILKSSVNEQQVCLHDWGKKSSETLFQVQKLIDLIGSEIKNVKEIHIKENDRMEKECTQIQSLQKALHSERAQFLEDLSTSRAKLEEIHEKCFQEKEACLGKCFEERKELLAEKEAVLKMKEQLYHADAALEKKSMEHLSLMQNETEELTKQRLELERARVMAAEIAQEVEEGRRELEVQCHAFKEKPYLRFLGLGTSPKTLATRSSSSDDWQGDDNPILYLL